MDDFQQAAAAARAHYTAAAWADLPVRAQAQAIYAELRRIDMERVAKVLTRPNRRPALRSGTTETDDTSPTPFELRLPVHAD